MGTKYTQDPQRIIIDDFAKVINERKIRGSKPEKTVIDFRNDKQIGREREIWQVPTRFLRFRKDNGRIASDVASYEMLHHKLDETLVETQEILRKFLDQKDRENNSKLESLIKHSGQNEPAIITADGFLINGNRRKLIIEKLYQATNDQSYETLKVVILPGRNSNEDGGPPTLKEIEQIENRYQLQSDGKSEYTNFDRAISIKRKEDAGMTLEEQLKDDPTLSNLSAKEFKKKLQEYRDEFLGPLQCIDRYLDTLDRDGLYDTISEGKWDKEGRWYSFIDYYKIYKQLLDEKRRVDLGIQEDEIGLIEDIAFKIIRKKDFPDYKSHEIIRKLPKFLKNIEAKKEVFKIKTAPHKLEKGEANDNDDLKTIDKKWGNKYATLIVGRVKTAINLVEHEKDIETTLTLLVDALKKLNHSSMDPESLDITKISEAMKKCRDIQKRANEIEHALYELEKKNKKIIQRK